MSDKKTTGLSGDTLITIFKKINTSDTAPLNVPMSVPIKRLTGKEFEIELFGKRYKSTKDGFVSNGMQTIYKIDYIDYSSNPKSIKSTMHQKFLTDCGLKSLKEIVRNLKKTKDQHWEYLKNDPVFLCSGINKNVYYKVIRVSFYRLLDDAYSCVIPEINKFSANEIVIYN